MINDVNNFNYFGKNGSPYPGVNKTSVKSLNLKLLTNGSRKLI